MITFESIDENFKFLLVEVENQVKLTFGLINDADRNLLDRIVTKEDYIDNLKTVIENECFLKINSSRSAREIDTLRAIHVMCVNLERIADFCVSIARQTAFLEDFSLIHQLNYADLFTTIRESLSKVIPVLNDRGLSGALAICQSESRLDSMYKEAFQWIMARLRDGRQIEDLITTLFIFRYLERIGDALLNIGEALIFATLGERIKIEQFKSLQDLIAGSKSGQAPEFIDYEGIWGTRSGCRIGRISTRETGGKPSLGIYKEGAKAKIVKEKKNLEHWERIMPGLTPHIINHQENETSASLLVEFLSGKTLDAIVLTTAAETIVKAVEALKETIAAVWDKTLKRKPVPTDYIDQIKNRLEGIQRIHPHFDRRALTIEKVAVSSSKDLLQTCAEIEQATVAPFTVFIHGDFNINNILFNEKTGQIKYIDCYRSKAADYIQDASVFLISNFRMPIFDAQLRRRLNWVIHHFYSFFAAFAEANRDDTFQLRMALALARSLYTSTRFELNNEFAAEMFKRALYLLEKIAVARNAPDSFRLPVDVLYY
jgi:phosphate uptake regulator